VLVTHLEEIKHAATHVVDIQRSNGLSSIRRVLR
jgi:DNA repair exonuclease SbcCD ATPase subunit